MYKKLLLEMIASAIKETKGVIVVARLIKGWFDDTGCFSFTYRAHYHGTGWVDGSGFVSSTGRIFLDGKRVASRWEASQ